MALRCPGMDMRLWRPEDVQSVACPDCGEVVEIWKDEPCLLCPRCGSKVINPRLNLGCAAWCQHGAACLELLRGQGDVPHKKGG